MASLAMVRACARVRGVILVAVGETIQESPDCTLGELIEAMPSVLPSKIIDAVESLELAGLVIDGPCGLRWNGPESGVRS